MTRSTLLRPAFFCAALLVAHEFLHAQTAPTHGVRPRRLAIRGAMVVEGNATPAEGPKDIIIEGNRIVQIVSLDPVQIQNGTARRPAADVEIDAHGKYVVPGLINLHGHVQDERGGVLSHSSISSSSGSVWASPPSGTCPARPPGRCNCAAVVWRAR